MKLKKLWLSLLVVLTAVVAAFACFGLAACDENQTPDNEQGGGDEQQHNHTWATEYSKDETGHWYAVTCEHSDVEVKGFAAHNYNSEYICTDCNYKHTHTYAETLSKDETGHWYAVTCGHAVDVKNFAEHNYNGEYVCSDCEYSHTHTYAETLSKDETGHWYAVTCGHEVGVKDFAEHNYNNEYVCTDCTYQHTHTYEETLSKDETDHWYAATCGHNDAIEKTAHDFTNGNCVCGEPAPTADRTSEKFTGKIYVVGDSTVSSFNDAYYLPRYGYGTQLHQYLNLNNADQVVNLAMSGRSSLSFLTEANYTTLKNSISSGDYLIIGFGHNDEKSEEVARYTDANGTYDVATTANGPSFAYTLYENYIKLANSKGATAILCTPIVRYDSSFSYSGSKVHDTTSSDKLGKGGDYAAAIRKLGEDTNTTVIDLTAITKADYLELREGAQYYHAHTTFAGTKPNETPDGRDDTHINKYGAKMVAYEFATALLNTSCGLKNNVVLDLAKPTLEADYADAKNAAYERPDYNGFDPSNTSAKNLGTISGQTWYSTVMGDVGGESKLNTITVTNASGVVTVANTGSNGKIASGADGFGAAFVQVDASNNFTVSATVTIKAIGSSANAQSLFGIMLRDDIFVDTYMTNLSSNYVLAGALGDGTCAIFSRENGALNKESNTTNVAVDSTYTVSLTRVGQTVTVVLNDGTHNYTKTYTDFDFQAVDNGSMYVCLVGNRSLTVEYSNITFKITGESQGA